LSLAICFCLILLFVICPPPSSSLFPYTTLFRSFVPGFTFSRFIINHGQKFRNFVLLVRYLFGWRSTALSGRFACIIRAPFLVLGSPGSIFGNPACDGYCL